MSCRTAMFFRPGYTKAKMGIKLSKIDPLIRIKTKNLKFFWGKNLYKEKLPKMLFLAVFGGRLVLFLLNGSDYSPEMLHLNWSEVDKQVYEKKIFGSGLLDTQNSQKSKKNLYTLLFWHVWSAHFSVQWLQTSWEGSWQHAISAERGWVWLKSAK